MGNVHAADSGRYHPGPGAPPPMAPPPPSDIPKPQQTSNSADQRDRNPGLYEELHKQSKDLFPQVLKKNVYIMPDRVSQQGDSARLSHV